MKSQVYVPSISAVGLLVVGHCVSTVVQQPFELGWLALAVLTLLTGAFTIKIPSVAARLSVSETFVFASVLLFGTCAGTLTVALEILIIIVVGSRIKRDPLRIIFNVSSAALAIWIAGHAFYLTSGIQPLSHNEVPLRTLIFPLAVLSGTYFLLNSGMVAIALAIDRRESALGIWRSNFLGLAVNYFGGASLAALFLSYTQTIDLAALGVIIPLLIIFYLSFRYSFSRVEDATQHAEEMKTLYLSTIETLATAIDAKDQVTHGHIRRVQQVTLGLARRLGVRDLPQLQALEAAALLHDIGKLVVPEHILNKPGKLTAGEFEKMKEHASVGAEILSSIRFPHPVVPIVRHHHENWDGTGYPDGLRGTDIPIGARILAVVDCFDALTSDRPYRGRMTDADAIAVLIQRRGLMYDPLIVDTFAEAWQSLTAAVVQPLDERRSKSVKPATLHSAPSTGIQRAVRSHVSEPLATMLEGALRRTGATLAILFACDLERDQLLSLAARRAEGLLDEIISMPLGVGVSGWVAVNKTAVVNAEPALDFPNQPAGTELVRSICVPIWGKGQVVGVLSLYVNDRRGFSEDDRDFLEQLVAGLDSEVPARAFELLLSKRRAQLGTSATVH